MERDLGPLHFSVDAAVARAHDPVARLAEDCIAQSRRRRPADGVRAAAGGWPTPLAPHILLCERRIVARCHSNPTRSAKPLKTRRRSGNWQRVLSLRQNPFLSELFYFASDSTSQRMEMQPHTFTAR